MVSSWTNYQGGMHEKLSRAILRELRLADVCNTLEALKRRLFQPAGQCVKR